MATVKLDPAKGVQIPNKTTTERNAISSPETGALVWNTTTSAVNQYNGSAWGTVGISEDTTKLPLAGGALTGAVTTNSTFDGVDIATRDAILTSTTTTAGAALPKAGGTMTGNIAHAGAFTLDVGSEINLDSDSGYVYLQDAGTSIGLFKLTSSDFYIKSVVSDKDIIFQGNDGGSGFTALTLDMSDAGAATFNNHITATGNIYTAGNINLTVDNKKIRLGAGEDLQIYHDGTHSYFKNSHTSGSTRFNQKYFEVNNTAGTESMLSAYEDGAVTLRYDGATKLKTSAAGLEIWGDIEMGGHFAFTGESGSDRLTINENSGAVWIDGNCSAASFTDRTPYPETLQLAYDVINSHQKLPDGQYKANDQSKQLDHSNLHEYVSLTTPATLWTENHNLPEGVSVGDIKKEEEKSRNMSGVISCLVEVIKDLSTKNEELEARLTAGGL